MEDYGSGTSRSVSQEHRLESVAENVLVDVIWRNLFLKAKIWPRVELIRNLMASNNVKTIRVS